MIRIKALEKLICMKVKEIYANYKLKADQGDIKAELMAEMIKDLFPECFTGEKEG